MGITSQQVKEKLKSNTVTLGGWITMSDPIIVEMMINAGYDWLVVDMEHSALTLKDVQNHVRLIELSGMTSLVRVGKNDDHLIKRVMDTGTSGVIVPMVNNREEAEKAVKAVRYPPKGTRGVGLARAQGYGMAFEEYKERLDKDILILVQIEHIQAVDNIEAIFDVEGIDSFVVGPYDLSGSIGHPGDFEHPQVKSALQRVMQVAEDKGMPPGFHVIPPDAKAIQEKIDAGFKFVACSLDTLTFGKACENLLAQIKQGEQLQKQSA